MKHSIVVSVLLASCLGFGLSLTDAAQAPATPPRSTAAPATPRATAGPSASSVAGASKIGVIAFQVAVGQTNEFQRDFADLQKKWDPKRLALKALSDEVDASTKALQAQGDKLSDAERASRAKAIDDKKKQLDRSAEDAQNDFQSAMQELYSGTASKVYDVMHDYAETHGVTLVLDVASQQTPVLYALPATDITKPVIDAYNLKSGVPAPPPTPGTQLPAAPGPVSPAPATKPPSQ